LKKKFVKPHKISTQSDNRWKKSNYQLSEWAEWVENVSL
jgi:hypothetical protein